MLVTVVLAAAIRRHCPALCTYWEADIASEDIVVSANGCFATKHSLGQIPCEHPVPAQGKTPIRKTKLLGLLAVVVLPMALVLVPDVLEAAPSGSSVTSLQEQASALAARIDTVQTKLQILGEEYDQAQSREVTLAAQISRDQKAIASARSTVQKDQANLQQQALDAYVDAGMTSGLSAALSSDANALPLQQTYLGVVQSNLSTAVTEVQDSEHALTDQETALTAAEAQATSAADTLASSQDAASGLELQLTSTLAGVNGSLAAAVTQQENAQAAQLAAQLASQQAAQQAAAQASADGGTPSASGTAATAAPSANGIDPGEVALKAAESQLGVPYIWAGVTPGVGFDCSGLTMWAWSQAGINLPHSAEAQYEDIEHVPFSQLEPGDLIFYASGDYIYHVVIYAGDGEVIQAIETGTVIQVTPIPYGAFAAGRP